MNTSVNFPGHSEEFVRAPLTYPGNKSELAEDIIAYLPDHETYVEPFGGTAGVLFNKEPSRNEVINDVNSDLTTFMRVLRDDVDELVEWLRATPYSEAEYDRVKGRWRKGFRPDDDVVQAGQLFFLRRASYGGDMTGFRAVATGRKNSARQFSNARERLFELADRLDEVIIRNTHWQQIIEQYASPDTIFYMDPPYRNATGYYEANFHYGEFVDYFIRHMDGTPNTEYEEDNVIGPVPPNFLTDREFEPEEDNLYPVSELPVAPQSFPTKQIGTEMYISGEHLSADDVYSYGGRNDPINFLISSSGLIDGLHDYTWCVRLDDYSHEINNSGGGPTEANEVLTMNYDPETITPFTGGQSGLNAF